MTLQPAVDHSAMLTSLEESLWRAETRSDRKLMETIFANDCTEFGRSGKVWSRSDLLNWPMQALDAVLPLPDLRVTLLDERTALITYTSIVRRAQQSDHARRSSFWSLTADGWKLRFHQGTPFEP